MSDGSLSNQIYLSRDQIRLQIIEYLQSYLELENVDLAKSSFLSFLVNSMSTLTSNLLFYSLSNYKEFFLTQAKLPESVLNLSAFLGYNPIDSQYAIVNALVTIPMTFSIYPATINIANGSDVDTPFKFYADEIEFTTYYTTEIIISGTSSASISIVENSKKYNLPFTIESGNLKFVLPLRQYKVVVQTFQVDSDLQPFQFYSITVPVEGLVSSIDVQVQPSGGSGWEIYTEYESLYLLGCTTKGYVLRKNSDQSVTIYFGNDLIGLRPAPESTIKVTIYETKGATGNIIAGSLKTGDRLYAIDSESSKVLNYSVINTSRAYNGQDEEAIQDIRNNAINSLVALKRLVSENDYKNMNVVVTSSPVSQNSLPILKRSDLIRNEIALFVNLLFGEDIVPTRNGKITVPTSTSIISRGTIIEIDSVDYYLIFDLLLDPINMSAYYYYILSTIELSPILDTSYSTDYIMTIDKFAFEINGTDATATLTYSYSDLDPSLLSCQMEMISTNVNYNMINDSTSHFTYSFIPYINFPEKEQSLKFKISYNSLVICDYLCNITVRQPLKTFMISTMVQDSTSYIIYDIPLIKNSYIESCDRIALELQTIQPLLESLDFTDYRMLTDFVNLKFTNTTGIMRGMLNNDTTKSAVLSIGVPLGPYLDGNSYIVSGSEGSEWKPYENQIAVYSDSTSEDMWTFVIPQMDDIVLVEDVNKKYIYNGKYWFYPEFAIPLQVQIDVFKSTSYYGTDAALVSAVKSAVYDYFKDYFGSNVTLYTSKIVDIVHNVDGVRNCNVIKPESNIFFNFDLMDLTKIQLLEYGPDYIYFTEDNISVRVI